MLSVKRADSEVKLRFPGFRQSAAWGKPVSIVGKFHPDELTGVHRVNPACLPGIFVH
jgi:hypothetical protein